MDIFCKIINGEVPSLTCLENDNVKCIMDNSPFTPGHVLVIPKKHFTTLLDLDSETLISINEATKDIIKKMEQVYPNMTGVKTVVNYGDEQKVKHYHLHILPMYDKEVSMSQEEAFKLLTQ